MRRFLLITSVILIGCGAGHAQSLMGTSALGATSPLSTPGSTASSATGIPLGATEIDPGGLSPTVSSNCGGSASYSGMFGTSTGTTGSAPGTSSTFDGGGLTSTSSCTSSGVAVSSGTASPLSSPGSNSGFTLNGGTIPLGATEMDSGGISPMPFPMPGSATPCVGSLASMTGC